MDVLGSVAIAQCVLECLGNARCGLGCVEEYWPVYIIKFGVVLGCFKVMQCVGVCCTTLVFFES